MKTKIIIFLIMTVALFTSLCISSFAYTSETISSGELVADRGDFFNDADEDAINEALLAAKQRCGADIRVFAYRGGFDYYLSDYINESEDSFDSLALLVIQYDTWSDTYYYYLDTYGEAEHDITDTEVNRILDNSDVHDNIKSGNLKEGILAFADLSATAVSGHLRQSFVKVLTVSLVIAAAVAVAVALSIYFSYKKKLHSESYPLERYASLNLQIAKDNFVTKFVTRVRIQSSSGSRSGGGRSGGGGSRRGGR